MYFLGVAGQIPSRNASNDAHCNRLYPHTHLTAKPVRHPPPEQILWAYSEWTDIGFYKKQSGPLQWVLKTGTRWVPILHKGERSCLRCCVCATHNTRLCPSTSQTCRPSVHDPAPFCEGKQDDQPASSHHSQPVKCPPSPKSRASSCMV